DSGCTPKSPKLGPAPQTTHGDQPRRAFEIVARQALMIGPTPHRAEQLRSGNLPPSARGRAILPSGTAASARGENQPQWNRGRLRLRSSLRSKHLSNRPLVASPQGLSSPAPGRRQQKLARYDVDKAA